MCSGSLDVLFVIECACSRGESTHVLYEQRQSQTRNARRVGIFVDRSADAQGVASPLAHAVAAIIGETRADGRLVLSSESGIGDPAVALQKHRHRLEQLDDVLCICATPEQSLGDVHLMLDEYTDKLTAFDFAQHHRLSDEYILAAAQVACDIARASGAMLRVLCIGELSLSWLEALRRASMRGSPGPVLAYASSDAPFLEAVGIAMALRDAPASAAAPVLTAESPGTMAAIAQQSSQSVARILHSHGVLRLVATSHALVGTDAAALRVRSIVAPCELADALRDRVRIALVVSLKLLAHRALPIELFVFAGMLFNDAEACERLEPMLRALIEADIVRPVGRVRQDRNCRRIAETNDCALADCVIRRGALLYKSTTALEAVDALACSAHWNLEHLDECASTLNFFSKYF